MIERVSVRNLSFIALIILTVATPCIYAGPISTNSTEGSPPFACNKLENDDKNLCCRSARWTDLLIFYITNYVAHAATTRTQPGQSIFGTLTIVVSALLFPMSGALRGLRAVGSAAMMADTDLQTAARAGALCMVVEVPRRTTKRLPVWGGLATKSIVAVVQAVYAAITLYNSRGRQIDWFGYAAFGLTVVPYAMMSVINLCANLICPEYPAMYLVSNKALQDLQRQYSLKSEEDTQDKPDQPAITQQDAGTAGKGHINVEQADRSAEDQTQPELMPKTLEDHEDQAFEELDVRVKALSVDNRSLPNLGELVLDSNERYPFLGLLGLLIIAGVIIAIIGALSRFQKHSSSVAQRVWTMTWLSFGMINGIAAGSLEDMLEKRQVLNLGPRAETLLWKELLKQGGGFAPFAAPAIGGMVAVGQMIIEFGVCRVF